VAGFVLRKAGQVPNPRTVKLHQAVPATSPLPRPPPLAAHRRPRCAPLYEQSQLINGKPMKTADKARRNKEGIRWAMQ
jgi:hypothetical protein